jgi:hypothetical protein
MRVLATILAFAIIGAIAFFLARSFYSDGGDETASGGEVFTGAYDPILEECRVLADSELPRDLEVGKDTIYMLVTVLHPDTPNVHRPDLHLVEEVNGKQGDPLMPLTVETEYVDGEGSYVYLIYRIQDDFEYARLKHLGKQIAARLEPE